MKICHNCGTSNLDTAKFRNECGTELETKPIAKTLKTYSPE